MHALNRKTLSTVGIGVAGAMAVIGLMAGPAGATATATTTGGSSGTTLATLSTKAGTLIVRDAAVQPRTGESCGTGSSSGNVTTCMYVNGGGLYIDYAYSYAQVNDSTRTIQSCIHGPDGTVGCTAFISTAPGDAIAEYWYPYADEPAGNYCANTWRLNSDGSDTEIGSYCVNVHA